MLKKHQLLFIFTVMLFSLFSVSMANATDVLTPYTFKAPIYYGSNSVAVLRAQEVLNQDPDTQIASSGPASPHNETFHFGKYMRIALIKFQNKYSSEILTPRGLSAGNGRFDGPTIAKLNKLRAQYSSVSPITTANATNVTATSATYNALYTAQKKTTSYFKYSKDGETTFVNTPSQSVLDGTGAVIASVTGLSPGKKYDVWGCLNLKDNVVCDSKPQIFTTLASSGTGSNGGSSVVPIVQTVPATNVGSTSAQLNATLNTGGQNVNTYFFYGNDQNMSFTTSPISYSNSAVSFNSALFNLTPSTTYYFKACVDTTVTTCDTNYQTLTTSPVQVINNYNSGPVAPTITMGSVTSVTPTTSALALSYVTNGSLMSPLFQYGISPTTNINTALGGASSTNGTYSMTLTGLSPSTTYSVRGCASYALGVVCSSASQTFTTPASLSITTGSASAIGTSVSTLAATYTVFSGTPTINFQYGSTSSYGSTSGPAILENGNAYVSISGLTANTLYHYRAMIVDGNQTLYGSDMTFTTHNQIAFSSPSVTNITQTTATLSMNYSNVPVDPSGLTSTMMKFEYGPTATYGAYSATGYVWLNSSGTFSETITGLTAGTTYHYRLDSLHMPGSTDAVNSSDGTFSTPPSNVNNNNQYSSG